MERARSRQAPRPDAEGDASTALCAPSSLQVYEAAATIDGDQRGLRLAIKNHGEAACHLAGSPTISLEDASGVAIAGIAIRRTGVASLIGVVAPPMREALSPEVGPARSVDFVLPPSGEASFEIGWSSGDGCPEVSSIAVGVASASKAEGASAPRFAIHHPLRVCGGEVRVTSLLAGSSV